MIWLFAKQLKEMWLLASDWLATPGPSILKVGDVAKMAKFVHKSVNHSLPKYFQTYFHKVSLARKRSTRSSSSDNLAIPLFRTSPAQRSIKYQGSKVWNSIPTAIQRLNVKKFAQTYREQILIAYKNYVSRFYL